MNIIQSNKFHQSKLSPKSTHPKTMQNGKISNNTEALIGKCLSSRVIAREANEKARLSNVN
jgi:hypothetical protein